jgi:hypothetical protein
LLVSVQGIVVQRTGNFTKISVLFGLFLLTFGAFLVIMKYVLRWQDRKASDRLTALRTGSDVPVGGMSGALFAAGVGAGGQGAGLDGRVPKGSGVDAALGSDTVLVQSDRGDVVVRPRVATYSAQDTV